MADEWNVDTLKQHFDALRQADKEAVSAALAAAEKAVSVAEQNSERWRASANEWRGAMTDREHDFARRSELRALVFALAGLIPVLIGVAYLLANR